MLLRRGPTSPVVLGAAALLALNDHVLKGAHLLPRWVTGKLSDFAGLFLVPVVAAAVFPRSRPRAPHVAALVAALVFAALKTSPAACAWLGAVGVRVACDRTDLLALPMLLAGLRFAAPLPEAPTLRHRLATAAAALACVATSPPRRYGPPSEGPIAPIAKEPPCALVGLAELEPRGPDAVAHVRVSAARTLPARCNVVLRVTVVTGADAGLAATGSARSPMLLVDPGEALDVAVTVPLPYPLRCDGGGEVQVESFSALDPGLPGSVPADLVRGPARCAAGLAR
jgi:hypothetical protein